MPLADADTMGLYGGPPIVMALDQGRLSDSLQTASNYIKSLDVDVVYVQHEFSFFDGGEHLVAGTLRETGKPVVVTFHTVYDNPPPDLVERVRSLFVVSNTATVPSRVARALLVTRYGADANRVHTIPLGMPDVDLLPSGPYKAMLGLEGRAVLTTLGFMGRNKGVERVLQAMPHMLRRHPNTVYMVIGETHPATRSREQESYREELLGRSRELGLDQHVIFINRCVPDSELLRYVMATDIYLAPYLDRTQVSSYTLNYAMGSGKAVIATPTMYAREVLGGGRGILSDFDDPGALAEVISSLLDNPAALAALSRNAYATGKAFHWNSVICRYAEVLARACPPMMGSPGERWFVAHPEPEGNSGRTCAVARQDQPISGEARCHTVASGRTPAATWARNSTARECRRAPSPQRQEPER